MIQASLYPHNEHNTISHLNTFASPQGVEKRVEGSRILPCCIEEERARELYLQGAKYGKQHRDEIEIKTGKHSIYISTSSACILEASKSSKAL